MSRVFTVHRILLSVDRVSLTTSHSDGDCFIANIRAHDTSQCLGHIIYSPFLYFISINLFKSTSQIEIKLKTYLIEIAYSLTNNPFFYLLKDSYVDNFKLSDESIYDWEVKELKNKKNEIYLHYRDYYLGKYDFNSNKEKYLKDKILIDLNSNMNINYPPFHYFIENVTLGSLINIISKLNVNDNSILKLLANRFGMYDKDVFLNYLLRLKELRNRCAHNGRLFNRNYRGLKLMDYTRILENIFMSISY